MKYRLFFAWQSQNRKAYSYIKNQLLNAQQELAEEEIVIDLIFSPTQEESGSPDIKMSILEQIKTCDVFVGDLSFIDFENKISNANVLYESGIADAFLGEERVIMVCDENTIIEQIAFDINHKRVSKLNTKKNKSELKSWIVAALEEADRQRYVKTYATDQFAKELLIIINYFMRLSFIKQNLPKEITYPSIENVETNLSKSKIPIFFLDVDFGNMITSLEEKLMRLNQFSHKRIVWNVINIISKLREYKEFCYQARFSFYQILDEEPSQYNLYDARNFYLKVIDSYSPSAKSILFLENVEIAVGDYETFVIDKRMIKKNEKLYKRSYYPLDASGKKLQEIIESKLSTINSDVIPVISRIIVHIIEAIKSYLDYCDLHLEYEDQLQSITIVD